MCSGTLWLRGFLEVVSLMGVRLRFVSLPGSSGCAVYFFELLLLGMMMTAFLMASCSDEGESLVKHRQRGSRL